MKESFWGSMILILGIISILFVFFFQNVTNVDQQNYTLIKEITEAAMYDSIDKVNYTNTGNVKINREKFIESFVRRYSEVASLSNDYYIDIYDISEYPPKVSLQVRATKSTNAANEIVEVTIDNKIDAILELPY